MKLKRLALGFAWVGCLGSFSACGVVNNERAATEDPAFQDRFYCQLHYIGDDKKLLRTSSAKSPVYSDDYVFRREVPVRLEDEFLSIRASLTPGLFERTGKDTDLSARNKFGLLKISLTDLKAQVVLNQETLIRLGSSTVEFDFADLKDGGRLIDGEWVRKARLACTWAKD